MIQSIAIHGIIQFFRCDHKAMMNDNNIDRVTKSIEFKNSQPNSFPLIHYKSISIFHSPPNSYLLPFGLTFLFVLHYSIWFVTISHKVVSLWSKIWISPIVKRDRNSVSKWPKPHRITIPFVGRNSTTQMWSTFNIQFNFQFDVVWRKV